MWLITKALMASVLICTTSGSGPGYTPWYASNWARGGTVGSVTSYITGTGVQLTTNSNDVTGPFGESQVLKGVYQDFGGSTGVMMGGTLANSSLASLAIGSKTWFRYYIRFPSAWCAGGGANALGDFTGLNKWLRFQLGSSTSARLTFQISGLSNGSCSSTATSPAMAGVSAESMSTSGGAGTGTNNNYVSPIGNATVIPRDTWIALQFAMTHGITPATSTLDMWIGTTHCAAVTMLASQHTGLGGESISSLVIGDYANGGNSTPDPWYMSNCIATAQTPTGVDGGGRSYIDPNTDANSFGFGY